MTTPLPQGFGPPGAWEGLLTWLSPVERRGDMLFKREDLFAPLGYGGVNGAKLRQCVWLIGGYAASAPAGGGVLSGASVKSPQLSMGSVVARHFGLGTAHVVGATTPASAVRHPNVAVAHRLGARFLVAKVGYNPALQRAVTRLLDTDPRFRGWYRLEYGIGMPPDAPPEGLEAFHRLGADQVANVPPGVRTLVVPAGSCNTCASVLYGVARHRPAGLERVVLFGIGPNRLDWLDARLAALEAAGRPVRSLFRRRYAHHPGKAAAHAGPRDAPYLLEHHDLHTTGYASYQDEMPETYAGLELHPTYEGKVMRYLLAGPDPSVRGLVDPSTVFWVVGSRPAWAPMAGHLAAHEAPGAFEALP